MVSFLCDKIRLELRGGDMPRARSPKRDEAYKMWLNSNGKTKLKDIASALGVSESQVRKWKNQDKWNSNVTNQPNGNVTKRKRGGQPGNHNATGPPRNKNAEKYGFFSKYLPEETVSIIQEMPTDPLDIHTWPMPPSSGRSRLCMSRTGMTRPLRR